MTVSPSPRPEVAKTVRVPARRRSAVLTVPLEDGRNYKAAVNAATITVSLKRRTGYSTADGILVPRNASDVRALITLLEAVVVELGEQDAFTDAETAARIIRESEAKS